MRFIATKAGMYILFLVGKKNLSLDDPMQTAKQHYVVHIVLLV